RPPIAKLTAAETLFDFFSGYTAKVAGPAVGISGPKSPFSACVGQIFLPQHATPYADLLGQKLEECPVVNGWMDNTGWTGGAYGTGSRISLRYTRAMGQAAVRGELAQQDFVPHPNFGVLVPQSCPDVPAEVLNPKDTWGDKTDYD